MDLKIPNDALEQLRMSCVFPWIFGPPAAISSPRSSRRWVTSASTVMLPEVGFGVPSLASFLPIPAGPGLVAIQSQVDLAGSQRFCLARTSAEGVPWHRFFLMFFGWCYDGFFAGF